MLSSLYGIGIDACCSLKGHPTFSLIFPDLLGVSDLYFNAVLGTSTFSSA
jgi:hypothetical protein